MASRFWVGGTGTWNASNTANWAATTGGAGGQSVPTSADTVTIDANSGSGTITVASDVNILGMTFNTANNIILDFSVNNNNVTIGSQFTCSGSGIRTLKMGNGTWTFSYAAGTATLWNFAITTNLTFDAGKSTIKFTGTANGGITFSGGGLSYWTFENARGSSTGTTVISGSNTFVNFVDNTSTAAHVISFAANTVTTVSNFFVRGSSTGRISLNQATSGATMVKSPGGVIACDWMSVIQIPVTPSTLTWYKGANASGSTSTGWIAGDPPSRKLSGAGVG